MDSVSHNSIFPAVASGVKYRRDGTDLLQRVDLRVEAGPKRVMLGPNGAGKSLLLRMLHGLIQPTAGSIRWNGRACDDSVRRHQAMVFQRPVLLRRSTRANLLYALQARGMGRQEAERRTDEWLERANLRHLAARPARVLSAGEQQRVAAARALACEPEILFLDEPTANLDPASENAIEELLLAATGTNFLFVTHSVSQARRLADEIYFISDGLVAEVTPAEEFFESPRSPAARAFLDQWRLK